jgi:hypothetical protein
MGANRTVLYVPPVGELGVDSQEWSIRDQSRKYLEYINKVTVKSLNAFQAAPECTSQHAVPALVFAMNGLTSNPWHDFSDVFIPLFITTRALEGEVQFLVYDKYGKDNLVVSDPESIHRHGWQFGMRYYWIEQDIRLNVTRFAPTLQQVLRMLRE